MLADRNWSLSAKLVEYVTKRRQLDDGRTTEVHMHIVKPAKWSFQTAAIVADIATKIGALAMGEATERTAHTIEGLTNRDLETMPLEQLLALRAQLERGKR